MHSPAQLEEYRKFLSWFEAHYPQLSKEYWQHITIPRPGEGVKVMSTSLDPVMFARLERIEYEYYHP